MPSDMYSLTSDNISSAWALAFLHVMSRGAKDITPLVVSVEFSSRNSVAEHDEVRKALDKQILALRSKHLNLQSCHTVANTIFPQSMWNPNDDHAAVRLFTRFEKAWPRIKRCRQNRRGSYFRRLTAFRPTGESQPVNQLEHIIDTYRRGNHRRSALQAAIFDPALDHKNSPQLGFPCLHQVAFTPVDETDLAVTAFYATQYMFDRAYGNYLGLCRLGRFRASEMGLSLVRMVCIASVAQLGTPSKSEVEPLAERLRNILGHEARVP